MRASGGRVRFARIVVVVAGTGVGADISIFKQIGGSPSNGCLTHKRLGVDSLTYIFA
jgi:hypothetical protein